MVDDDEDEGDPEQGEQRNPKHVNGVFGAAVEAGGGAAHGHPVVHQATHGAHARPHIHTHLVSFMGETRVLDFREET